MRTTMQGEKWGDEAGTVPFGEIKIGELKTGSLKLDPGRDNFLFCSHT
jgi:hypothetical protein